MFDLRYTNDIVLLVWIGIAALLSKSATKKKVTVLGQEEERYSLLFAVIAFFPIFWFVTTVFARGDMYAYWIGFDNFSMSVSDVIHNWTSIDRGPAYSLLVAVVKSVGVTDYQVFRTIIAIIQSVPLVLVFSKYSEDYTFSLFLFIATMSHDTWMLNAIRQFIAVCILFLATSFLVKKKSLFLVLFILIAIQFHQSAIMMIPIFIMAYFKPWSKWMIASSVLFVIALLFYNSHNDMVSEEVLQLSNGSHPLRFVISSIPVVLTIIGRKKIAAANNRLVNICVNITFINAVIYAIATVTNGITVGRLPGYTVLYSFLLYPYLLNRVFNERISKNLRLGITLLFIAYFIFSLYFI